MGGTRHPEDCISHGPWGGLQGKEWILMPEGYIRKITIRHGGVVDSLKFFTGDNQTSFFGGKGGQRTDTICIDYPNEYLVSVSGTFGSFDGSSHVVRSICFVTNENCYGPYGTDNGPYGTDNGTTFSYYGKGGVIVGFHGRVDKCLTSIGVYVIPKSLAFGPISTYEGKIMNQLFSSMSQMTMPKNAGPWGAGGGKPWDDGVFSAIRQARIHLGELNVIYAIQFEYQKNDGKSVLSPTHGRTDGSKIEVVNLGGEDEFFTGISGFYGPVKGYNGLEAIAAISFYTNKRVHGPYGEESGVGYTSFYSPASCGKVVGFHGRSNGFLSKIGVHMEYL